MTIRVRLSPIQFWAGPERPLIGQGRVPKSTDPVGDPRARNNRGDPRPLRAGRPRGRETRICKGRPAGRASSLSRTSSSNRCGDSRSPPPQGKSMRGTCTWEDSGIQSRASTRDGQACVSIGRERLSKDSRRRAPGLPWQSLTQTQRSEPRWAPCLGALFRRTVRSAIGRPHTTSTLRQGCSTNAWQMPPRLSRSSES